MTSVSKLIITVFCLIMLPIQSYALTPGQVFEKVKSAVVVVKTFDIQGEGISLGSGVLISPGRVATNYHVVKGGITYQVGQGKHMVKATIYTYDRDKDICLLDTNDINGIPVQIVKTETLKVGDLVYAVGAPQGFELSLTNGVISQLRGEPIALIQTTAAISPGSSGGGLFDSEGQLIGLTTFHWKDGQSLNFAVPAEWIGQIQQGRKLAISDDRDSEWKKNSNELIQKEDWQGLIGWGRKWIRSEPKSAKAWAYIGYAYRRLERYNESIEAYQQSLSFNTDDAYVWFGLGLGYRRLKRYNESIEAYQQSLSINPGNAYAWSGLAFGLFSIKRYNESIEAYRKSLSINPDFADDWYALSIVYSLSRNKTAALNAAQELKRLDPVRADNLFKLIMKR